MNYNGESIRRSFLINYADISVSFFSCSFRYNIDNNFDYYEPN